MIEQAPTLSRFCVLHRRSGETTKGDRGKPVVAASFRLVGSAGTGAETCKELFCLFRDEYLRAQLIGLAIYRPLWVCVLMWKGRGSFGA